jgi:hypothetical protein
VTPGRRDGGEIEALVTDRYLDSLLAIQPVPMLALDPRPLGADDPLRAAVRAVSRRLATDLPRFHPSFRFEERLALRLAEVAASMHMPVAAGGEGQIVPMRPLTAAGAVHGDGRAAAGHDGAHDDDRDARQLLIGGAVAASALSLAGAWLAWRRRTSPMARAGRAAHHMRQGGGA